MASLRTSAYIQTLLLPITDSRVVFVIHQTRGTRQARQAAALHPARRARPAVLQGYARQDWPQAEQVVLDRRCLMSIVLRALCARTMMLTSFLRDERVEVVRVY